jgi:glycosyltransferase involved in cell wall biosynthesis
MSQPVLSINIAVLNAEWALRETIESLKPFMDNGIEIVVSSGDSTDGTLQVIQEYSAEFPNFVGLKKKDTGIYDALNNCLKYSSGKYILCLGAGDYIIDPVAFTDIINVLKFNEKIIYSDLYIERFGDFLYKSYDEVEALKKRFSGLPFVHHQTIFVPREMFSDGYDLKYGIHADFKLIGELSFSNEFIKIDKAAIAFRTNGVSSRIRNSLKSYREISQIYLELANRKAPPRILLIFLRNIIVNIMKNMFVRH